MNEGLVTALGTTTTSHCQQEAPQMTSTVTLYRKPLMS